MPNFMPLDNVAHADLKIKVEYTNSTGDDINQVLVFLTEFNELQREYPIVFRRSDEGQLHAVVILGLSKNENLFLSNGQWKARYIPAVRMRGPFTLSLSESSNHGAAQADPVIHVDMDHPNISSESGLPVFLPQGGHAPYLSLVINALQRLHVGSKIEAQFFSELEKFKLIEEITLEAKLSDTEQYTIPDVYTINQSRMAELTPDELHQLNQLGLLEHCYAVLSSIGNMSRIIEMKSIQKKIQRD